MSTYKPINEGQASKFIAIFDLLYTDFLNRHGVDFILDSGYNFDELCNCISRVHQREHYYKVYHDMSDGVSEVKRIALYCYWILKYNPFRTKIQSYGIHLNAESSSFAMKEKEWKWRSQYLNERFCLYLLTCVLRKVYGEQRLPLTDPAINDLLYSLKHHDISKEALIEMFEMIEDVAAQKANQALLHYEEIPTQKV